MIFDAIAFFAAIGLMLACGRFALSDNVKREKPE